MKINPLRYYRKSLNLSQAELAHRTHMTRLAVLRYEQALYATPSSNITNYLAKACDVPNEELITGYIDYQLALRLDASQAIRTAYNLYIASTHTKPTAAYTAPVGVYHFFNLACEEADINPSRVGFAKLVCIHPDTLAKYEYNPEHMPPSLKRILGECGLKKAEVAYLETLARRVLDA